MSALNGSVMNLNRCFLCACVCECVIVCVLESLFDYAAVTGVYKKVQINTTGTLCIYLKRDFKCTVIFCFPDSRNDDRGFMKATRSGYGSGCLPLLRRCVDYDTYLTAQ